MSICPVIHPKYGGCERTDGPHKWHKARGEKWSVEPSDDVAHAAPAAGAEGRAGDVGAQPEAAVASSGVVPGMTVVVDPEMPVDVAVLVGADQTVTIRNFATDIPPEVAEVLAKQQAAQVEQPKVDTSLAPEGTVRAVYTGSSASKLAPSIEAEMKRRLKLGPELKELPRARPQDPPRQLCTTCGVTLVGFDVAHSCDKGDILRLLKPKGLHEALPPKLRFSGRYRLCLWRDAEGEYHVAEELVDESGAIVAFNVLDGPEPWGFMGARILDLVVEKFTP